MLLRAAAALIAGMVLAGCAARSVPPQAGAIPVRVARDGGHYVLMRGGSPYHVKGAGLEFGDMASLAAHGGNSLRTWRIDNDEATGRDVLDEAARNGLTVAMCIEIGRERKGFDYDDRAAVEKQLEYARREVLKYKDHPALLAWIIGNEPNLSFTNPKVFDAINDISRMIHAVDGKHPTTTALAGFDADLARLVESRAPDLDFVSIQMYGDIVNLQNRLRAAGYSKPYMVTEWGPVGTWEARTTAWGAPIEQNSSEKARFYQHAYEVAIAADPDRMLGSYTFLWGHKQERTPTWFGMLLPDGSETEVIDVMHRLWSGAWPANRSPRVMGMTFDGKSAGDGVVLRPGGVYEARIDARDPDGDDLRYRWVLMRESSATQVGGDDETAPPEVTVQIDDRSTERPRIHVPSEPGAYRLYAYAYDGHGHAGYANIPFLVR